MKTTDFAAQLRAAITARQLSQPAAARLIPELSPRTFQGWITGRFAPPLYVQGLILKELNQTKQNTH